MIRTYKRKLKLTVAQENTLRSWIGACRVVYNMGLEIRIDSYNKLNQGVHKYELMKQITGLRKDIDWINEVPIGALQNSIDRLDGAYNRFFKRACGFPKFSSKKNYKSIVFKHRIGIIKNYIKIPKLGTLPLIKDAEFNGRLRQIIIKIEPTGFFACITCDNVTSKFLSKGNSIGLDVGLAHFVIDSNGTFISNPRHFKCYERKLRIENRSLSRKVKHSKSWHKQVKKLSLLHHKIGNVRKDFLHKQSTLIAKANSTVYLEDLKINNMVQNHKLSKHILDAGWGMFRTMLEYKTNVIRINPAYTSQTCNECKAVDKLSRISQSEFVCTSCGHTANADLNAAKNIKSKGIALERQREALACA